MCFHVSYFDSAYDLRTRRTRSAAFSAAPSTPLPPALSSSLARSLPSPPSPSLPLPFNHARPVFPSETYPPPPRARRPRGGFRGRGRQPPLADRTALECSTASRTPYPSSRTRWIPSAGPVNPPCSRPQGRGELHGRHPHGPY